MASPQAVFLTLWASSIQNTKQNLKKGKERRRRGYISCDAFWFSKAKVSLIKLSFWEICEYYTVCNNGLETERDKMEK